MIRHHDQGVETATSTQTCGSGMDRLLTSFDREVAWHLWVRGTYRFSAIRLNEQRRYGWRPVSRPPRRTAHGLPHLDEQGRASMVDVGCYTAWRRRGRPSAIGVGLDALRRPWSSSRLGSTWKKGDVLSVVASLGTGTNGSPSAPAELIPTLPSSAPGQGGG